MIGKERALFERALIDGMYNSYNRELELCEKNVEYSPRHIRRMTEILSMNPGQTFAFGRPRKRALVAIILAAALLLTGCAVYVYRDVIGDFIVTAFERYFDITIDNNTDDYNSPPKIEEKYSLGYVPDGYELVKTNESSRLYKQIWKNDSGEELVFEQWGIDAASSINSELGDSKILDLCGQTVYYRNIEKPCYLWSDGKYYMILYVSEDFSQEDFEKILQGIKTE